MACLRTFKALGLERMSKAGAPPSVHKCYTHVPVSSYHSALHHQEAFGIGIDKFYPVGIPRTDIFFDEDYKKKTCERVYAEFPGAKEAKRVILYARHSVETALWMHISDGKTGF